MTLITAQLLFLEADNPDEDISFYPPAGRNRRRRVPQGGKAEDYRLSASLLQCRPRRHAQGHGPRRNRAGIRAGVAGPGETRAARSPGGGLSVRRSRKRWSAPARGCRRASPRTIKAEYGAIAERRVRLGLILLDIGQKNQLKVKQHELKQAIMNQARRYPGQEQKVLDLFRNNPSALEQLRAPLYKDKVVDFILQMANVSEKQVTPEELMADPDTDGELAVTAPSAAAS